MNESLALPRDSTDFKGDTTARVLRYYRNSPSYLEGPLQGTCHFGYTPEGEQFELQTALRRMENLLGETIGLPAGSKVLDAGCGFGRVAATLSERFGYDIVGVDLMHERLGEAQRYTAAHNGAENVELVNANYCNLPIRDSSFSAAYTIETLVHADPLESALGEFMRILKPGGKLVLFEYSVPERDSLDSLRKKITDIMVERTGMASVGRFTHDAFPDLLQSAGFENVNVADISRNVWPTWRWMFWRAVRHSLIGVLNGNLSKDDTNLTAALLIWPYRSQLGYKAVTATKPA